MSKEKNRQLQAVIAALEIEFPKGISTDPRRVLPLCANALHDIIVALKLNPDEAELCRQALAHYQDWTPYLEKVALIGKQYSIFGQAVSPIGITQRAAAKQKLLDRRRWTLKAEQIYKTRIGELVDVRLLPEYWHAHCKKQIKHEIRYAKWLEKLIEAGFGAHEIAKIQQHGLNTDNLDELRVKLERLNRTKLISS